jgi:hypothetical protein
MPTDVGYTLAAINNGRLSAKLHALKKINNTDWVTVCKEKPARRYIGSTERLRCKACRRIISNDPNAATLGGD